MQKTQNLQDTFLNYIRREKIPVTLFLMNGFQLRGIVRSFDSFAVLIEADGHGETTDANILAVRKRFDELYAQYKPLTEAEAEEVRAAGGLFIIGTERHESRRIDNQCSSRPWPCIWACTCFAPRSSRIPPHRRCS